MNICDANVLVALANDKDSQHAKAKDAIRCLSGAIEIPNGVLVETANVLWRLSHDAALVAGWCTALTEKMDVVPETTELIQNAMDRYKTDFKRFSLVDCQIIEWAKTEGAHVLTFDEEIKRELSKA